jgi:hypothetical protein
VSARFAEGWWNAFEITVNGDRISVWWNGEPVVPEAHWRIWSGWLRRSAMRLLPTNPGESPVPAAALNVAAQLLAAEEDVDTSAATSRVHAGGGAWVALNAQGCRQQPGDAGVDRRHR